MGLRFAAGNDALAAVVRENQDLSAAWQERDKTLVKALAKGEGQRSRTLIDSVRKQIADIENKIAANSARLEKEFPAYVGLANPKPLQAEETQGSLGTDEAL